jgi:hypothetical protein
MQAPTPAQLQQAKSQGRDQGRNGHRQGQPYQRPRGPPQQGVAADLIAGQQHRQSRHQGGQILRFVQAVGKGGVLAAGEPKAQQGGA